jgi:hypothetical protein
LLQRTAVACCCLSDLTWTPHIIGRLLLLLWLLLLSQEALLACDLYHDDG